ncbi:Pycsar system effector family protein [Lewinella cohaerens]|uniref:Pycsar system effector family protein n=1 Tax=Lewinella cohaerens TaxID=70995 RepID=UPI0003AB1AF6|nr:Pycsar system effector family protein [Lewinella cohaerens]
MMKAPEVSPKQPRSFSFSKETVNVIRTTLRNNIELTAIADNKANVLLSLNAVMIAFVVPLAMSNLDVVFAYTLFVPLFFLAVTCFATIYISTLVLAPFNFDTFNEELPEGMEASPFFFGTAYHTDLTAYYDNLLRTTEKKNSVRQFLAQDLFFIGRRLGQKMLLIRRSFQIFRIGIFLTLLSTALVLIL